VSETLLSVSDVTINKGLRQLLRGVDLAVKAGEIWRALKSLGLLIVAATSFIQVTQQH